MCRSAADGNLVCIRIMAVIVGTLYQLILKIVPKINPSKAEVQTAVFKDPGRTAL